MVFIAYQADLYKEYVFPNTDNSDFSVLLDKYIFGFREDIKLHIEIADSAYRICPSEDYRVKREGIVETEGCILRYGDILSFKTKNGERFSGIIAENAQALNVITKFDISNTQYISIGEDDGNIVSYRFNDLVSKFHCEIRRQGSDFYIYDNSTNGIFLNSKRLGKSYKLNFGDVINVFGLQIVFLGNILGISSNYGEFKVNANYLTEYEIPTAQRTAYGKRVVRKDVYFSRSPRMIHTINNETIVIEEPPNPKFTKKKPALYTIGPAFTMAIPMLLGSGMAIVSSQLAGRGSSAFMFTGIITAVGSAIIGVIWALLNMRYSRQSEAEEERERFNAYGNYLMEQVNKIKEAYLANTDAMNKMYPSASDCCKYNVNTASLWSRNRTHSDFLFCRLGLGDVPFQVDVNIPKEKFNLVHDSLREKPSVIKKEYETLKNVPVGVDLAASRLYGIVGEESRSGTLGIMYDIVAQVAANNCYTDLKMVFIYDENTIQDKEDWEFARWLPHVWSEDKKTRYLAANKLEASDVFYELANIMRIRSEEASEFTAKDKNTIKKPYYLVFVQNSELLEGQLISKYIFDPRPEYGITTFIMSDVYTDLPNECVDIIQCDHHFSGIYNTSDSLAKRKQVNFDRINRDELLYLAKNLSDVKVNEIESMMDVPQSIDFLEMYGVGELQELAVTDRWRKNRTFNTMKALIGKKAGGEDCFLDVHEKFHGPHGLIAGTTGSGKSEVLQTYILSLAINFSPEDVAFFVIDYKGGGMANLFADLPHMIGHISNLSGNQIRRAMISIKSENRRRQRLFNDAGVNNINHYTRLYKNHEVSTPVPHLFIIIDEFAELKKEEPDFMRELISVAQVGRSLGVHLILATQKPSGTVDDNIWSNSKFRLCLRVQDRQDSNDMLHKPDAAYISQAGRAYLQVGNDEIYELFQSGWSGAAFNESGSYVKNDIAKMIQNTGKTAIVGSRHQKKAKDKERLEWYCRLIESINIILKNEGYKTVDEYLERNNDDVGFLAEMLITSLNTVGIDYAQTTSNKRALENLIRLLPKNETDPQRIIAAVTAVASERGIRLPEKKERTQLEGVVEYLNKTAKAEGYNYNLKLWLPVLPEKIYLEDIDQFKTSSRCGEVAEGGFKWDLSCVVGIYDDPENQSQLPLVVDFANNGHHAVCGMVVSGKSTFMQTVVYSLISKYTPEQLNMYLIDFSSHLLSPFESAPHCGGVITDQDPDKISKFFCMLDKEMKKRKELFGGGDYVQYLRSTGEKIPAWVIAVDNYAGFREKTNNEYDDQMLRLAKEGIGYGIYLIMSAGGFGITEIPTRIGDNIRTVISLELGDKFKYMDVMRTTKVNTLPEVGVKGRGLVNIDGSLLEFHTALAVKTDDDFAKSKMLSEKCARMNNEWTGPCAKKIPQIPQDFTISLLEESEEYKAIQDTKSKLPFALCESDASIYSIDLSTTYCYSITGKARTGKTTALKVILNSCVAHGGKIILFEKGTQELKKTATTIGAEYISTDKEHFSFWSGIKNEFVRRNQVKRALINDGLSDVQIYEKMKEEEPIFFFISDMNSFLESVYKPEAGTGDMKGFIENVMDKGILHNIFIFACIDTDSAAMSSAYPAYKSFVGYKTGVHLGGNINSQRIFTFQNIPFAEQSKAMKKGIGLVPSVQDDAVSQRIVIPTL